MRILMTTDALGGVWQYSLSLARGLVERHGCQIALVCFGEPGDQDLVDAIPDGVELISLRRRLEWMPDSARDVQESLEEVGRLAARWRPDVVHSNQFCFGHLDAPVPRIVVAHSDVLSWMLWTRSPATHHSSLITSLDPELRPYRELVAAGLKGATAVVCPSRFMARSLKAIYGRISRVIHNGLCPDLYPQRPKTGWAVVAGRLWDEAKRAETAVRAVEGLPVQLRLVGPTVGPSGEQSLLPSAPNVHYLGPRSWKETRDLVAASRVYLATSTYEPFGLAALEAAFSGCALLANDTAGFRELWQGAALFYSRDDHADLRRHLAALLESPEETERLGRAARRRALERYTAERMAAEYFRLYQEIRS